MLLFSVVFFIQYLIKITVILIVSPQLLSAKNSTADEMQYTNVLIHLNDINILFKLTWPKGQVSFSHRLFKNFLL